MLTSLIKKISIICLSLLLYGYHYTSAQEIDRFISIQAKLTELSKTSPGLNEKVEVSVSDVTIQEFLQGIATSNNINLSVDPNLNTRIVNNFTNVTVIDVLLFLANKYELDISFIGSIISVSKRSPEPVLAPKYVPRSINITYDKANDFLSYDLSNDSLLSVAKALTKTTGKNVVLSPDIISKSVTGFVQNTLFNAALDKLAFSNDLKVTETEDGFFLIEKKDVNAATKGGTTVSNARQQTKGAQTPGLSFKVEGGLISLDAYNSPINDIINTVSEELGLNYFLFSEPKGNATLSIKNSTFEEFLKYLLNGSDFTFRNEAGIYMIGDRNIEGLRGTKVIQFRFRTIDKIMDIIPSDMKKGVELKAFPDLNSLIVSGSQPRIDEIEAFMRDIDRVVPVVVIEVLIVDVRNSRTVSTGIEAGLGKEPTKTGGKVFPGVDLSLSSSALNDLISGINGFGVVNLGKVTPNFYLKLKLLEEQGILNLRSTPKLATLNGHEAKMSIGKTEYYLEVQNNVIGTQNPQNIITQQYKSVNADLSLTINPIVSGDEQITLTIGVKQSNFTERISPSAPPGTITRDFQSLVRVKNEEMVILGGLEENATNDAGSGLPLLSRIPVIKWLFSNRTKSKSKSKLTIFIKPTIIY